MKTYYYYIDPNGKHAGPFELKYFKDNKINAHTYVWFEGLPQWVEAHTLPCMRKMLSPDVPKSFSNKADGFNLSVELYKTPHSQVLSKELQAEKRANPPKTWMTESILVTIFCCLPLGLAGMVYASKVMSYWNRGLYGEALHASDRARLWVKVALSVTIIIWTINFILYLFTPVADSFFVWYNDFIINSK